MSVNFRLLTSHAGTAPLGDVPSHGGPDITSGDEPAGGTYTGMRQVLDRIEGSLAEWRRDVGTSRTRRDVASHRLADVWQGECLPDQR